MKLQYLLALHGLMAIARSSPEPTTSNTRTPVTTSSLATASPCPGNLASDRTVWCDYDISTDYDSVAPDTGVVREYWFDIQPVRVAPDGYPRTAIAINGSIPGPTIIADWGDTVIIHVINNLGAINNGTSIHWHGIRQNHTNGNDGTVSITQCPTAPGTSVTYTWRAVQYGSSWYHSHIGLQAWEGVYGGIIINGPATANYDEDKGVLFLTDWSHPTADELYHVAQIGSQPMLDNGLINGTNVYSTDANQTGTYFCASFDSGKSYRLRLVNGAIDSHFKFSIDNHTLLVIANDLVPIKPYRTNVLDIAIGQRYDVIVTADQKSVAESFWLRAIPQKECSLNGNADNIRGIVYYDGATSSIPETIGYEYTDGCVDEDVSNLVPYLPRSVGTAFGDEMFLESTLDSDNKKIFHWYLNNTAMDVAWDNPTLLQIYNNRTAFSASSVVIELPDADKWVYIVIETAIDAPHPMHLHGHDFYILAQNIGTYNNGSTVINISNPPRRDTALLPSQGYLAIAFKTDNPGAWLMHCHVGWHSATGFALQFVERYNEIEALVDYDSLKSTCESWSTYNSVSAITQEDSGV